MKVAVVADIHSNAAAFWTVLDRIGDVDIIWCLGDIVGYGPDPVECIDLLRSFQNICVAGNHDLCAVGSIGAGSFNPAALLACEWTRDQLDEDHLSFLRNLPLSAEPAPGILITHGSPAENPWDYITSSWQAEEVFTVTSQSVVFVAHTHVPLLFMKTAEETVEFVPLQSGEIIQLDLSASRYLINPGSVGQPRDGDARASFILFDTDANTVEYNRVEYVIEDVQERMQAAGLPPTLGERLKSGV